MGLPRDNLKYQGHFLERIGVLGNAKGKNNKSV